MLEEKERSKKIALKPKQDEYRKKGSKKEEMGMIVLVAFASILVVGSLIYFYTLVNKHHKHPAHDDHPSEKVTVAVDSPEARFRMVGNQIIKP